MAQKIVIVDGKRISVPDDATIDEINALSGGVDVRGRLAIPPSMQEPSRQERLDVATSQLPTAPNILERGAALLTPESMRGRRERTMQTIKGIGSSIWDAATDPGAMGATAGGMLAGARRAGRAGTIAASAAGGAVGKAARVMSQEEDPEGMAQRALMGGLEGAVEGAAGEYGAGKLSALIPNLPLPRRPVMDPRGQQVLQQFGPENVSAHQLTDSGVLNFLANVSKFGMGGKAMRDLEERQAGQVMGDIVDTAGTVSPTQHLNFNTGAAGQALQKPLAQELAAFRQQASQQYEPWLQNFGKIKYTNPKTGKTGGRTLAQWHEVRSDALHNARTVMNQYGKGADHASFMAQAADAEARMDKVLNQHPFGAQAKADYDALAAAYKPEIRRLDNPTVWDIRENTPSNEVIPKMIGNRLRHAPDPGAHTGVTYDELVARIHAAAPKDDIEQLRADTLVHIAEEAVDPATNIINNVRLNKLIEGMDDQTRARVLGPQGNQLMAKMRSLLDRVQASGHGAESGRFFTTFRGPAAVSTLAGATAGLATGSAGAGLQTGVVLASAILAAPKLIAFTFTNPTARKLFIRATNAKGSAAQAAEMAFVRYAAQRGMFEAGEAASEYAAGIPPPPPSRSQVGP